MNPLQATDDKHLIFENQFEKEVSATRPPLHSDREYYFWGDRYLCIHGIHDEEFWRFDIFDLLTNDSKSVRFQKSSNQFQDVMIFFLNYKFMLVLEITNHQVNNVGVYHVNLVQLNWESGVFELVEHVERRANVVFIIVDSLNQSKFVVSSVVFGDPFREYQDCKLVNGKIAFGDVHRLPIFHLKCSNGKLIRIHDLDQKFRIKTYNMLNNQERTFETETCPEHVQLMVNSLRQWIIDRLYAAIRFRDSGNYGLMWTNAKTRRWTILDFLTTIEIQGLHFFEDTLLIYAEKAGTENGIFKSNVKFYGVDICHPQPLRQKAWLSVIRNLKANGNSNPRQKTWLRVILNLKANGNSNPYKEASRYLPFNSDIRPHWFEDVEEEATLDQGQGNEESDSDGTIGKPETSLIRRFIRSICSIQ